MTSTTIPQPLFRTVDGVRIRYADSGGRELPTVLLTSPWPESLYAFAPVWPLLSGRARLFAVDLPGFGASQSRPDLLSPRAMGQFLVRLIDDARLGAPHVVAPDVGTSAALFAAVDHPDSVSSLIVGAGATAVPLQLGEPLASWVSGADPDRDRAIDPRVIVNNAVDAHARAIPAAIRADYLASYAGLRFVESMRYVRRYPDELPVLAGLLPRIQAAVTVLAGRHDHVVPLVNAEFLRRQLPDSRLVVLEAGHFAWEEAPRDYAAAILQAIGGQLETRPRTASLG